MKKYLSVGIIAVVIIILFGFFGTKSFAPTGVVNTDGVKNATYIIDGQKITLKDGLARLDGVPDPESKSYTQYLGNDVFVDLDNDGMLDTVFVLTQSTGGTGNFRYLVGALKTTDGYTGSNAFYLGDRIVLEKIEIGIGNTVVVNYLDRTMQESFAAAPTVPKKLVLLFRKNTMDFVLNKTGSVTEVFNNSFFIDIGEDALFPDGLSVTLREINDSRCKAGMTCIWQGELSPAFVVNGNGFSNEEVRLGTERTKSISKNGYTFTLQSATETSATIVVSKTKISEPKPSVAAGCFIGGCSAQICSDQKDMASTCEYREAYACYKTAKCERQTTGMCGWTETAELAACLKGALVF